MMLIGGIHSEHILVFGVTTQCPAEGFLPKKVRPAQWPVQWQNFAPNRGGLPLCFRLQPNEFKEFQERLALEFEERGRNRVILGPLIGQGCVLVVRASCCGPFHAMAHPPAYTSVAIGSLPPKGAQFGVASVY